MKLRVLEITDDMIAEAEQKFSQGYLTHIREQAMTYENSLVGRYTISKLLHELTGMRHELPMNVYNTPDEEYYFSYSHTHGILLAGVHTDKIWVDVEICKPRDEALLKQYEAAAHKVQDLSWEWFYQIRTSQEALVKYLDMPLNEVETIQIVDQISQNIDHESGEILPLTYTLSALYQGKTYEILYGANGILRYAVVITPHV